MSRHQGRGARSRTRSRIAVVLTGAALLSWAGPGANAFWTATSNSGASSASADGMGAGATPTATVSGGNVTLAWNATTTLAGRPVTGYTVARYASASAGTKSPAGGTCSATVTAGLGCTDQGVPTGTWYYTVTPVLGQWQGVESVRSSGAAVDTTPPGAPTVVAPAYVYGGNVAAVPVSGTTEPGASIALAVTDAGDPLHTVNATVTANSAGTWDATVNLTGLNAGTLTYRAVATDTAGNQGNPATPGTASSIKDVTAPIVTGVLLEDGGGRNGKLDPKDKATITFGESLDASTICSNWAASPAGMLTLSESQATVNIVAGNTLSVAVDSSVCPTSRIGTVALGGNYYGSGTLRYKGTVSWDPSTKALTVTLGAYVSGNQGNGTEQPAVPFYTPASGMGDLAGNLVATAPAVAGTKSRF